MNESVLDTPKQKLDETMWVLNNGSYTPTPEATEKINSVIEWVMLKTGINSFKVHITGSITSNQYSDDSDIDLHFISETFTDEMVEDLNKNIRELFQTEYKTVNDVNIGTHEIEIYFQINEFQDMMSIGCYDFINKEWIVGPEFLSTDFDPYSEYYNDDMKYINSIISDIRNVILEIYELLIVINNSNDEEFKSYEFNQLIDKLAKAANIFTNAREFRKVYSTPTSKEDALSKRSSRKWKIADSAFKLLDKFGYLAILRDMTSSWESIQDNNSNKYNIINTLIQSFDKNLNMNPNINENDRDIFSSHLNESLSKNISVIALIASMLAIPDVTNAKNLTQDLKTIPIEELKISNPLVTKFINKNANIKKEYGSGEYKLSYSNLINLLATIAYNEGMEDYISPNTKGKKYDERALTCPLWTIINRAGGDANKFAEKILEPSQYYSMKHIISGRNLKNYKTYHPGVGYSKRTWDMCNELAKKAINGTLPMPVDDNGVEFGKRNMIANKKKDNKKSYEAWGKNCIFSLGGKTKNSYGYESCHDGWKDAKTIHTNTHKEASSNNFTMYEVKRGDTITQLSKRFKTTKEKILKLNKTIKDGNKIYPGQKIKIPKT